ncbi:hypothetical protein Bca4012_016432 [Brassica carinata]|uniref:Uncharacterized protein n=1 Tax=Brassica carinata TaxID=52824 RepID=A0A8X7WRR0_BRACI|nr:hypothetical protein Bca52824_005355 [Brassica carinata]
MNRTGETTRYKAEQRSKTYQKGNDGKEKLKERDSSPFIVGAGAKKKRMSERSFYGGEECLLLAREIGPHVVIRNDLV